MKHTPTSRRRRSSTKSVLRMPDLEQVGCVEQEEDEVNLMIVVFRRLRSQPSPQVWVGFWSYHGQL